MGDPPSMRGSYELILVTTGHDEVGRTVGGLAHVLRLEVAATRRPITVYDHLMIGDDVLARIERFEGPSDARLDRVASDEILGQVGRGIGQEHLVEVVPLPTVEGPGVANRQIDDGLTVESQT